MLGRAIAKAHWRTGLRTPARAGLSSAANARPLRVLGIETSCDDTGAAVVTSQREILSEAIHLQHKLHEAHGGIVPIVALASHSAHLPGVVRAALDQAGVKATELDAIAVTRGPGIHSCLSVGMNAAKTLAAVLGKPLIGVNHMEGHALMARFTEQTPPQFPFLCLLISGGHTLLLVAHDVNHYTQLGTTLDDAVGEAYDKVARMLEIPWLEGRGGGPGAALELLARRGDPHRFALPVPMRHSTRVGGMDFSFAGLKTAVQRELRRLPSDEAVKENQRADMAASFQYTVIAHLLDKLGRGFKWCRQNGIDATSLVISGGVASNQAIRASLSRLAENNGVPLVCPPAKLCTDNGVMIAWAGMERLQRGLIDDYAIDIRIRWPLEELQAEWKTRSSQKATQDS
ncbi:metalloendopeptidase [Thamnocephalis sphaerospora]|uniref:N(6)-L-threonylcarbamoyladenine synthase n=1 Tax=Thamnocephalis sphaerospora TaxID=78915 RepID=A0A4P9XNK0_9FUNG|nr:metalloendopeptidase [Thamnocephalis sphaerospora]RKP07557.1 metalloendopeptidase [Thamnocephalis sphaerospora]RKP07834.1 metalloendopeptidase [Thamnocephalis sphaerospora]|eukprot:RKP06064.1 metalloendopeptidase [Thamnocephalis sphaerospora]